MNVALCVTLAIINIAYVFLYLSSFNLKYRRGLNKFTNLFRDNVGRSIDDNKIC